MAMPAAHPKLREQAKKVEAGEGTEGRASSLQQEGNHRRFPILISTDSQLRSAFFQKIWYNLMEGM